MPTPVTRNESSLGALHVPRPGIDIADGVDAPGRLLSLVLPIFFFKEGEFAQLLADRVEEVGDTFAGRGRDLENAIVLGFERRGQTWQVLAGLDEIDLVQGHQHRLGLHLVVERRDLGIDGTEILQWIATFEPTCGIEHVNQHLGAPHMAQELVTEPRSFGSALDQAGDIRHHKRLAAGTAQGNDSEIRGKRRERIVRDFRLGAGTGRQQGGLPGIRKSDQTDVGDQAKLESQPHPVARLAQFGHSRSLVSR